MTVVFYDGVCGLCDRFVQFLLQRDRSARLRFAPLQGSLAQDTLTTRGFDPRALDTVFVVVNWKSPAERVVVRSRAVLHALRQLDGPWGVLAAIGAVVPTPISDLVYRFVARVRYRLFGRFEACLLPPPEWRERFIE